MHKLKTKKTRDMVKSVTEKNIRGIGNRNRCVPNIIFIDRSNLTANIYI